MRKPCSVRSLTTATLETLQEGLWSFEALIIRRCHSLWARARGETVRVIAETVGCDDHTVRHGIHAFYTTWLTTVTRQSSAPQRTPQTAFNSAHRVQLRALWPRSPRPFDHPPSLGTFPGATAVASAEGRTARPVSREAVRRALTRLGGRWQRAKHWIPTSMAAQGGDILAVVSSRVPLCDPRTLLRYARHYLEGGHQTYAACLPLAVL